MGELGRRRRGIQKTESTNVPEDKPTVSVFGPSVKTAEGEGEGVKITGCLRTSKSED